MSPGDFVFLRPWWLLALVPVGLLLWRLGRARKSAATAWKHVVDSHLAPHVLVGSTPASRRLGLVFLGVALILAILALAGPSDGKTARSAMRPDVTRMLVVDLSAAMAATDVAPSRLERVKLKLLDTLRAMPGGQTGLLVYAGEPYLVVPPSTDAETLARFIPELAPDVVPAPGDRPDLALGMAGQILARSGSRRQEILWVTSGTEGGREGLPKLDGVILSIFHAAPVDDAALAAVARDRGGRYVRLLPDGGDVRELTKPVPGNDWITGFRQAGDTVADRGYWLVLPLLPLAALAFRRGLLILLLAPLFLAGVLAPPQAAAEEGSLRASITEVLAWRKFRAGDADGAAGQFSNRRWLAAAHYRAGRFAQAAVLLEGDADPDSLFNRGNALAKQGHLADALALYEQSLKQREDADTRHNRDLVEELLKRARNSGQGAGGRPPPAGDPPPQSGENNAKREAARLAEKWMRQVPDAPETLLRRKLQAEHRRRQAAGGERSW